MLGFILVTVPWPNLFLGERHISCSGVVCSSCSWLLWASTISSLKYNQPVWFSYQEHFLCFTEVSWIFFLHPILKVLFSLGENRNSWNCCTVGRCQLFRAEIPVPGCYFSSQYSVCDSHSTGDVLSVVIKSKTLCEDFLFLYDRIFVQFNQHFPGINPQCFTFEIILFKELVSIWNT